MEEMTWYQQVICHRWSRYPCTLWVDGRGVHVPVTCEVLRGRGILVQYCHMWSVLVCEHVIKHFSYVHYLYDQAEKDRAKALEHELEGARAIIGVAIVWGNLVRVVLCV